jgi:hypothetical protein
MHWFEAKAFIHYNDGMDIWWKINELKPRTRMGLAGKELFTHFYQVLVTITFFK